MPEPPDFASIARRTVFGAIEDVGFNVGDDEPVVVAIVGVLPEELRLAWNARGAADIAKLEATLPTVRTAAEPVGPLTRALRSLDASDKSIS